jgi:uncharacterized protein YjiS (DUF1127 family)
MSSNSGVVAAPSRPEGRLNTAAGRLVIAHLWKAYWEYQASRATVVMLRSLDDRTLADIGLTRSEITFVVFGGTGRPCAYDPNLGLRGRSQERVP